jgi:rhodanese-related sulfurtransferase
MLASLERRPWLWAVLIGVLVAVPFLVIHQRPESMRPLVSARFPSVRWVDTTTLAEWMERPAGGHPIILDARTSEEFAVSHLRGARRVDPEQPAIDSIGIPQEKVVVVYCSVGYRSGAIAEKLEAAGFETVYNLEGGIFAWANEGRPVFQGDRSVKAVHPYDRIWAIFLRPDLRAPLRSGEE